MELYYWQKRLDWMKLSGGKKIPIFQTHTYTHTHATNIHWMKCRRCLLLSTQRWHDQLIGSHLPIEKHLTQRGAPRWCLLYDWLLQQLALANFLSLGERLRNKCDLAAALFAVTTTAAAAGGGRRPVASAVAGRFLFCVRRRPWAQFSET